MERLARQLGSYARRPHQTCEKRDWPAEVQSVLGDGVILRYYKVSEMDPVIDELVQDLNSAIHEYGRARKILQEHKLDHLL